MLGDVGRSVQTNATTSNIGFVYCLATPSNINQHWYAHQCWWVMLCSLVQTLILNWEHNSWRNWINDYKSTVDTWCNQYIIESYSLYIIQTFMKSVFPNTIINDIHSFAISNALSLLNKVFLRVENDFICPSSFGFKLNNVTYVPCHYSHYIQSTVCIWLKAMASYCSVCIKSLFHFLYKRDQTLKSAGKRQTI
jgi:hypothetical protein